MRLNILLSGKGELFAKPNSVTMLHEKKATLQLTCNNFDNLYLVTIRNSHTKKSSYQESVPNAVGPTEVKNPYWGNQCDIYHSGCLTSKEEILNLTLRELKEEARNN